ncbi:Kinesin motor domain family protein [Acanthocheilonema viteae]
MDFCRSSRSLFQKCKCHHEIERQMIYIREDMMKAHLEVKNQLIHSLENIIDEQEGRIRNMDDYINGRIQSFSVRNKILKGISLLSLEFGTLSEENLALKEALVNAQRSIRLLQLKMEDPLLDKAPEKIDKVCQTNETKQDHHFDLCHLHIVKKQEELKMQIFHEKNNNHGLLYDQETIATLQKSVKQLMEAKIELKKLISDIQIATREELYVIRKDMEIRIGCVIKSLIRRYQKEIDARKRLHNKLVEMNGNIRVFCRIRPALDKHSKLSLLIDSIDNGLITVESINGDRKKFNCDRAFTEKHTQSDIFEEICPIITSCMDGYNVCIFAYGHTGSGKTYTMEGLPSDPGVYQRSLMHLFRIAKERLNDIDYIISISMLEIYNEKIRDLLSNDKNNLPIRIGNDGMLDIPGLRVLNVNTLEEVQEILEKGRMNRVSATTDLNDRSSRSHAVVCVRVRAMNRTTNAVSESRLNLVDLAGSERVSQSGATGQQLKEAQCINRSLSELSNVVSALRQRQQHIPFRNCQLTRLLENCLNGDSKTFVIVQLVPDASAIQETVSSLNFADKLSKVQKRSLNSKVSQVDNGPLSTTSKHGRPHLEPGFLRSMSVRIKK